MATEPPVQSRWILQRGWRWIAMSVGLLVLAIGIIASVRWLASREVRQPDETGLSLEAQWNSAIRKLGIEPVYPPEEDLTVGDLFATVVSDDYPSQAPQGRTKIHTNDSFLGKSVKLGHVVGVAKELEETYALMPYFRETDTTTGIAAAKPEHDGTGSAPPAVAQLFGRHEYRQVLPRAAFPGLTIYHTGTASAGVAAKRGWFDFGAANEASQKLQLGIVETYGLDAVTAVNLLNEFCKAQATARLCSEDVARRHLRSVVGDRVLEKFLDPIERDYRYYLGVRLIMVSRVYLAREILEQWSTLGAEGGSVQAAVRAAGSSQGTTNSTTTLEERIAGIEKQLADLHEGGALVYRSRSGTEIFLDQKFPRPLAIGYRSVPYDFVPGENK
jgi:hypothetical protein